MKIKKIIPMVAFASISLSAMAQGQTLSSGIDLKNMDNSVRPQDDFFQYACGGWMKNNPLPAAYSRYGSFDVLGEDNNKRINGILTELLEKTYPAGTVERKLSDLYKLAMDEKRRDAEGVTPLKPILNKLEKAKSVKDLFAIQLSLIPYGDSEFFGLYIGADQKNAKMNIINVMQGGTTLGQKEYYLDSDPATVEIREAYKKHVVRMFKMFGFSEKAAEAKMKNVLKLETELAKVSKSNTELRDPEANYNKMTLDEFNKRYPNVQISKLLGASGINPADAKEVVVGQTEFMAGADKLIASLTPAEYRDYMEWGQIMSAAGYLSDEVAQANFDFFGKTMSGRKENHPLWKRLQDRWRARWARLLERFMWASISLHLQRSA